MKILLRRATQALNNQNTLYCTVNPSKYEENQKICFHHHCQACLIQVPGGIISTLDPMQIQVRPEYFINQVRPT